MRRRNKIGRSRGRRIGVEGLESRQLLAVAVNLYPVPAAANTSVAPAGIVSGPGGLLWFTEETTTFGVSGSTTSGSIGTIDPTTKAIVEYPIPRATSNPAGIVWGPDGDLWFADFGTGAIGQVDPTTHAIVEYPTPTNFSGPLGLTVIRGKIWFTEYSVGQIGAIDPVSHQITEYHTGGAPTSLALAGDGNIYFTSGSLGKFNPTTHATAFFPVSDPPGFGFGQTTITSQIVRGPDGGLYFGTATPGSFGNSFNPHLHEIGTPRSFPLYDGPGAGAGGATGGIAFGPDGKAYYTSGTLNFGNPPTNQEVRLIGSLDPATGTFALSQSFPAGNSTGLYPSIAVGPDGQLWFTASGSIGEATIIRADQSAVTGGVVNSAIRGPDPGAIVYADLAGTGVFAPGDPFTVADANGVFTLTGVPVGTNTIRVIAYPGDFPTSQAVTTTGGNLTTGVALSVQPSSIVLPISFGPAPFGAHNPDVITAEVTGLYNILLGRAPDAPGLAGWVNLVKTGTPFSTVVNAFLHDPAYYDRAVAAYYPALDGRAGTPAEIDAWAALLQKGSTEEQVVELMLTSEGFNAAHPTDASFIQSLYNILLGRQPTADDLAGWGSYLAGSTRANVVDLFVHSDGAYARAAEGFIPTIWGVPAISTGIANVVAGLRGGSTLSAMAALFFGSREYATYANKSVG